MANVAAYARYSSDNQDDNSLDTQFAEIRQAVVRNGDVLVAEFADSGVSGRTGDREQFQKMIQAIKAGLLKVEKLYVFKFSRFMRDAFESSYYKRLLRNYGVHVVSVREPLPQEKGMADLMETVIEGMDRFFLHNLGEHVSAGMRQLVTKGYWSGGVPPYGYQSQEIDNREGHSNSDGVVKRAILKPDAKEAAIVRRIYEISVVTGQGGYSIYKQLCRETGTQVLGKLGKPLGGRGVNEILRKPIYKGIVVYGQYKFETVFRESTDSEGPRYRKKRVKGDPDQCIRYQDESLRIVCDDLWEGAQAKRLANSTAGFGYGAKRANYLLTGLCRCKSCGGHFAGHWQHSKNYNYHYYRCRNVMNGAGLCENQIKLDGEELERAVLGAVESLVKVDENLDELVTAILVAFDEENKGVADQQVLRAQLDDLSAKAKKLVELALKLPDTQEIAQQLRAIETERALIETKLATANPRLRPSREEVKNSIRVRMGKTLELLHTASDQAVLRNELKKWIEAIEVHGDGTLLLKWKMGGETRCGPLLDLKRTRKTASKIEILPNQRA